MSFKSIILSFLFVFTTVSFAQTNSEIAEVYVKRSEALFFNSDMDKSLEIFNKALKYMDSIPNSRVAKLGTLLHFEHQQFFEARSYAKWYFELEEDKTKEEYSDMLETYVNIQEEIDKYIEEQKVLELQRLKEDREAKRLDSLNNLWSDKSKAFQINIDSIYTFNKYNLAVFSKDGKLGIMNDVGTVVEEPLDFKHYITYDGYVLMLDKPKNPTKIFAYNCKNKQGQLLPSVAQFNSNSSHFGKVMLPRANGLLVAYPNNTGNAFIYNLEIKSVVASSDLKEFLKELKKNDIIEKYKDNQIRINKQWLTLGNTLGAGVYELYENNTRYGYLNTSDGKIYDNKYYNYLGGFCNGNFELLEDEKRFWLDADGVKREKNKNENGNYSGVSRFIKQENGSYYILQNRKGKDYLILGKNALLNRKQFVSGATF
ncbi:hypothetical protein HNV10_08005 [Winogradskyella litoriviva]|uniref:WG repeat protein n=1 Tax=Winogradskyella litoriviva TaxID=1220182 RepID=A0ABX2E3W4_9FLAO|nr:hypothetical protein [Winogradskyella litoriviva]NRD23180.1 hypothetical protein [Winogradskyella litoriviva]